MIREFSGILKPRSGLMFQKSFSDFGAHASVPGCVFKHAGKQNFILKKLYGIFVRKKLAFVDFVCCSIQIRFQKNLWVTISHGIDVRVRIFSIIAQKQIQKPRKSSIMFVLPEIVALGKKFKES